MLATCISKSPGADGHLFSLVLLVLMVCCMGASCARNVWNGQETARMNTDREVRYGKNRYNNTEKRYTGYL